MQLRYFSKHFSPVDEEDLSLFHKNIWNKNKPGLILTFDDGYRSAYEVVYPLLEKYGFKGWFFIPSGLIDIAADKQPKLINKHKIRPKQYQYESSRVFLTWEQILELDKGHFIGCHTLTHCRLNSSLSDDQLYQEIVDLKQLLERKLNHEITAFSWVGGEEASYSRRAAEVIRKANYKYIFLTNNSIIKPDTNLHLLNRTNIECNFPLELLMFQISGFLDLIYLPKRSRVAKLLTS